MYEEDMSGVDRTSSGIVFRKDSLGRMEIGRHGGGGGHHGGGHHGHGGGRRRGGGATVVAFPTADFYDLDSGRVYLEEEDEDKA